MGTLQAAQKRVRSKAALRMRLRIASTITVLAGKNSVTVLDKGAVWFGYPSVREKLPTLEDSGQSKIGRDARMKPYIKVSAVDNENFLKASETYFCFTTFWSFENCYHERCS